MADHRSGACGFTLLELMIAVSILVILASVGVPQYVSALRTARVSKAQHELVTISHAIDSFTATNGGQLPLALFQVGFGGKLDPWGVPYCYLNYAAGTGDGLNWAVRAGLVNPAAFGSTSGSSGGGGAPAGGGAVGGSFESLLRPLLRRPLPQAPAPVMPVLPGDARTAATTLFTRIGRDASVAEFEGLVSTLTSEGHFDLYVGVATESTRRRDQYMFPLNTDYDLFSLGADGRTSVSLGAKVAQDDVIRANNGGFYGLASTY